MKLKTGIIGAGMAFERLHYPVFQQLKDKFEITAVCDVDKAKADKWVKQLNLDPGKAYTDYHRMLENENLDIVDVIVPIELNYEVTESVARSLSGRGKGIICEKPLAPDMEQAEKARELPQKYGIAIMIAENYRYNQENDLIRDIIRTKRIGDVFYFIFNRTVDFPVEMTQNKFSAREWRQHPEFPGGAITDMALHDLAGLRHIFGAIDRLQAFGRPNDMDFSPYSVINANLMFKGGVTGQYSFFCHGKEMQRPLIGLRIFGTEGMVYLQERNAGTINLAFNNGTSQQVKYEPHQGYFNELQNFYNAMVGSEPIGVTPELEFGDLKTVQDILRSIKEETVVSVDEKYTFDPEYWSATEQGKFLQ